MMRIMQQRRLIQQLVLCMISTSFTFCTQTNEGNSPKTTNTNQIKPLYTNRVIRFFSNQTWRDTLSVDVNGESIITGEAF
jgi:hypothetical protein